MNKIITSDLDQDFKRAEMVQFLDEEHDSIKVMLKTSRNRLTVSCPIEIQRETLDHLIQHFKLHFHDESAYLTQLELDLAEKHRLDHGHLLKILQAYKKFADSGQLSDIKEQLFESIEQWFDAHMVAHDSLLRNLITGQPVYN